MDKKILVISPFPSHPQDNGPRMRIYNLLSNLKKLGHKIHFVYENRDKYCDFSQKPDIKAMKETWDGFYLVPLSYYEIINYINMKIGRFGLFIKHNFPRIYRILKTLKRKINKKNEIPPSIDNLYNPYLDKFIKRLSSKMNFNVVIVELIFLSKALEYFDNTTLKLIDTHDALTSEDSYKANKKHATFIVYTNEEEAKALNRADIIIAIQDREKDFFSKITDKKVVTIGHIVEPHKPIKRKSNRKNIFFIGHSNYPNKYGIDFFIKKVFPKIRLSYPDAKLIIAGKVSNLIEDGEGIIKLGEIKNLEKAYSMADVVISPLFEGTGLKIKNIEALAHCIPLITTSFSANGLEKEKGESFLVANDSSEFIEAIVKIFSEPQLYEKFSINAYHFIQDYNQKNLKTLRETFQTMEERI